MPYSCPDCGEALTGAVREIELEEGESAQVLDDKRVVITTAICSNGCSAEAEKPKRKKKSKPAEAEAEQCNRSDECSKPRGHTGRCNRKRAEETVEA
jgi:hypothetical protein